MSDLFEAILRAHEAIRPQVPVTPLQTSLALSRSFGCDVLLKCEHFQPTGSFKIRGATNKVAAHLLEAKRHGLITASTGNHGQAVARAGALAGVQVTVYVAASAAKSKTDAIRAWGAKLVVIDGAPIDAETQAREQAAVQGKIYVSPYNDFDVMAGQGTLGVELTEQAPDLDAVFIAVGGGGLIGGVGTALKHLQPRVRVIGVWPINSPCMLRAMEAGEVVDVEEQETLSDGTAGAVERGSLTVPVCREVIDETLTVSEVEIASAMRQIAAVEHWIIEGAAAVALAGMAQRASAMRGQKLAVVICGRNIGLQKFLDAIAGT